MCENDSCKSDSGEHGRLGNSSHEKIHTKMAPKLDLFEHGGLSNGSGKKMVHKNTTVVKITSAKMIHIEIDSLGQCFKKTV